jgi:chemotaxis methyl-accepting protein methylase
MKDKNVLLKCVGAFVAILTVFTLIPPVFCDSILPSILSVGDPSLKVEPTSVNYYLNSLVGEDDYYADNFYDDYLVTLDKKQFLHFTRDSNTGDLVDTYFYIDSKADLKSAHGYLAAHKRIIDKISPKIVPAFSAYEALAPGYAEAGVYDKVGKIISDIAQIDIKPVLTEHSRKRLDAALYRYLCSNGIKNLKELSRNKQLFNIMVDKFYMLSTTCFYRAWEAIRASQEFVLAQAKRAKEEHRPFKVNVYACSTGEEVMTYAIELLENGITDFTILASDINDSSLKFAQGMRYSRSSFDQLPFAMQEKLKKYFTLNAKLNIWQPKDPDFFKARIKYMNLDILKPMPKDLPTQFAPPYDLVSILNVLMYLDLPAIEAQKNYWKNITNPSGGVLILHDKVYSILRRKLGDRWGYDNFYIINDWVNVRNDALSNKEKIKLYEKYFDPDHDESLIRLNNAYLYGGQEDKALKLCEDYLKTRPLSFVALYLAFEHYVSLKNVEKAKGAIETLARIYIFPERILDSLAALQADENDKEFLGYLKKEYQIFSDHYKSDPGAYQNVFDFSKPASPRWDSLRLTLKAQSYACLQRQYIKEQHIPAAEEITKKCLQAVASVRGNDKNFYIASRFADEVLRDMAYYYIAKGEFTKLSELATDFAVFFDAYENRDNYVFILDGAGVADLYKCVAIDHGGVYTPEFINLLDKAEEHYRGILFYEGNLGFSNLRILYQEIGHCCMLRGKYYRAVGDKAGEVKEWSEALGWFETSITTDPVYGKDALKLRNELLGLAKHDGIDIKPVEVK